ncbi:MAG: BTAD domain-containing putative transcriptional regulator, partial [Alphaproteobacteria bacterium]|nr:BTAD domain-containing putative transcriptional regulator [Alphaproteobacteria bacterium]
YLARLGRYDLMEAQFQKWQHVLAEDFGLEPTPETLRLYQELLGNGKKTQPEASPTDLPG